MCVTHVCKCTPVIVIVTDNRSFLTIKQKCISAKIEVTPIVLRNALMTVMPI